VVSSDAPPPPSDAPGGAGSASPASEEPETARPPVALPPEQLPPASHQHDQSMCALLLLKRQQQVSDYPNLPIPCSLARTILPPARLLSTTLTNALSVLRTSACHTIPPPPSPRRHRGKRDPQLPQRVNGIPPTFSLSSPAVTRVSPPRSSSGTSLPNSPRPLLHSATSSLSPCRSRLPLALTPGGLTDSSSSISARASAPVVPLAPSPESLSMLRDMQGRAATGRSSTPHLPSAVLRASMPAADGVTRLLPSIPLRAVSIAGAVALTPRPSSSPHNPASGRRASACAADNSTSNPNATPAGGLPLPTWRAAPPSPPPPPLPPQPHSPLLSSARRWARPERTPSAGHRRHFSPGSAYRLALRRPRTPPHMTPPPSPEPRSDSEGEGTAGGGAGGGGQVDDGAWCGDMVIEGRRMGRADRVDASPNNDVAPPHAVAAIPQTGLAACTPGVATAGGGVVAGRTAHLATCAPLTSDDEADVVPIAIRSFRPPAPPPSAQTTPAPPARSCEVLRSAERSRGAASGEDNASASPTSITQRPTAATGDDAPTSSSTGPATVAPPLSNSDGGGNADLSTPVKESPSQSPPQSPPPPPTIVLAGTVRLTSPQVPPIQAVRRSAGAVAFGQLIRSPRAHVPVPAYAYPFARAGPSHGARPLSTAAAAVTAAGAEGGIPVLGSPRGVGTDLSSSPRPAVGAGGGVGPSPLATPSCSRNDTSAAAAVGDTVTGNLTGRRSETAAGLGTWASVPALPGVPSPAVAAAGGVVVSGTNDPEELEGMLLYGLPPLQLPFHRAPSGRQRIGEPTTAC